MSLSMPTATANGAIASEADVREFLASTRFDGYHSVPLPHGLRTPGHDRTPVLDSILGDRVAGRTVLDVGTYYGLFPCEAIRRGATEAVGVERHPGRFAIANRIAELHGNAYHIIHGEAETMNLGRRFDIVLFLNVLHHVTDPVAVMRALARACADTVIVEFALAPHPAVIRYALESSSVPRALRRLHIGLRYAMLKVASHGLPIVEVVGNQGRHGTFFMSRDAFHNMFVRHHRFFDEVEFLPSQRRYRTVALCRVAR